MNSKNSRNIYLLTALLLIFSIATGCNAQWQPKDNPIMTKWAKDVNPNAPLPEYPRPQFERKDWKNLNGLWDYAITKKDASLPKKFDGKILVPFPIESALSGVKKSISPDDMLWYHTTFNIPKNFNNKNILLHFGAVDFETTVYLNGKKLGKHLGCYDSFTFDITDKLNKNKPNKIVLAVTDPTDTSYQPRGKQNFSQKGIWYTPVTGIWQTVWIEPVEKAYIESVDITPDIDAGIIRIKPKCSNDAKNLKVTATAYSKDFNSGTYSAPADKEIIIPIENQKLWSPESPFLYDLKITLTDDSGEKIYDSVKSYFGMRKISINKDKNGINRIFLNNEPTFQYGPLDQGWWPDGLYTAPTDKALKYDIEATKLIGCNMARKHVKVEPDRWYYWCDKLGLIVWQDMPSGDRSVKRNRSDSPREPQSAAQFEIEMKRMIDSFRNHPSIVMWVTFNEAWGQYDTERIAKLAQLLDPTRLINSASGWVDRGFGHVNDIHVYPGPGVPPNELNRAGVLGEFGGLGLPVSNHTWQDQANWGYKSFTNPQQLTKAYMELLDQLYPMIEKGLAAAVYTQTTDVEIEVNGYMTYDRKVIKMDPGTIAPAHRKLTSFKP